MLRIDDTQQGQMLSAYITDALSTPMQLVPLSGQPRWLAEPDDWAAEDLSTLEEAPWLEQVDGLGQAGVWPAEFSTVKQPPLSLEESKVNKKIKFVNKVRLWSFVICFASGGSLILAHFGHLGFDRILTGALWRVLEILISFSIVVGVVTTFIMLIDSAGNGLNTLQNKKDAKRDKKRH